MGERLVAPSVLNPLRRAVHLAPFTAPSAAAEMIPWSSAAAFEDADS
jgi:hypothetical protein